MAEAIMNHSCYFAYIILVIKLLLDVLQHLLTTSWNYLLHMLSNSHFNEHRSFSTWRTCAHRNEYV